MEYIRSSRRRNHKLLYEGFVYVLDTIRKKEEISVNLQYQNLKEYKTKLLHYQSFCHQSRQYFNHRNFDFQKISLFSASCPFVKMSFRQKVRSSNCPLDRMSVGKLSVRQAVFRQIVFSAKCPATTRIAGRKLGSFPTRRYWLLSFTETKIDNYFLNNCLPGSLAVIKQDKNLFTHNSQEPRYPGEEKIGEVIFERMYYKLTTHQPYY